ncbi:hypothetical protein ABZZ74_34995 [Streptomyces sp. NPDC006476]
MHRGDAGDRVGDKSAAVVDGELQAGFGSLVDKVVQDTLDLSLM